MNLFLCPLGAMPCCHGAGGLAGQHKFGARHGAAVVFLGCNKMILAMVLGGSASWLMKVLEAFPNSILALMLVVCGHELALMGLMVLVKSATADSPTQPSSSSTTAPNVEALDYHILRKNSVVALVTVIVDVGLHKTHYAAFSGWVTYMVYADGIQHWCRRCCGTNRNVGGVEYSRVQNDE